MTSLSKHKTGNEILINRKREAVNSALLNGLNSKAKLILSGKLAKAKRAKERAFK